MQCSICKNNIQKNEEYTKACYCEKCSDSVMGIKLLLNVFNQSELANLHARELSIVEKNKLLNPLQGPLKSLKRAIRVTKKDMSGIQSTIKRLDRNMKNSYKKHKKRKKATIKINKNLIGIGKKPMSQVDWDKYNENKM